MKRKTRLLFRGGLVRGLAAFFLVLACGLAGFSQTRTFPDTTYRIVVFTDQLNVGAMTTAQRHFAATHYAGSQKLLRKEARALRVDNPGYLVLHYRLGQGLGYRYPNGCSPTGAYLQIIDMDSWVQEWPTTQQDQWFYKYGGSRVYNCDWGYYLMDLSNAAWRTWWSAQVITQLGDNEDDGLFADSYSIPNYLGPNWDPPLPDVDATFESEWAAREHNFTDYIQTQFNGRWKWIPNLGAWITTRDPSNYSNVDGAMIENFAFWGTGSYFDLSDWQLQMNRTMSLTGANKIVIAQSYPGTLTERMFALGSYLLIKGGRTYVNLQINQDMKAEWYPEYGVDLGGAIDALTGDISDFFDTNTNVYVRHFANGAVYVNPDTTEYIVPLGTTHNKVVPSGGGVVPTGGATPGTLTLQQVSSISVPAHGAVIVLDIGGGCTLSCNANAPTSATIGKVLTFNASSTAVGCSGTPVYSWSFGDGGTGSGAHPTHAYASAGLFTWTVTVSVSGKTCTKSGTVKVTALPTTPVIGALTKGSAPFRITVTGGNLQKGIKVYINGVRWTNVSWVSKLKIVLNGGNALKAKVPRAKPTGFQFVNPDAGSTSVTWSWH